MFDITENEKNPLLKRLLQNMTSKPIAISEKEIREDGGEGIGAGEGLGGGEGLGEGENLQFEIVKHPGAEVARLYRKSAQIREVDSGSCGACELEIAALGYPQYDMERFGFNIVASPRHADMIFITGAVTKNMQEAVRLTIDAAPRPRIVAAVGDCACGKGLFCESYATLGSVEALTDVDLKIYGCPPPPKRILKALLSFLETEDKG